MNFRAGLSRHVVRFLKAGPYSYAIKETSPYNAVYEFENYIKLIAKGIHTLIPAGTVIVKGLPIEVKTRTGISYQTDDRAFIITLLESTALPDSYLAKLNFKDSNRKQILKAISELFAVIHFHNIYWGDASLANMMIRFVKEKDAHGRVRTALKAVLADAETVEFLPSISENLRKNELENFHESMEWMREDLILLDKDAALPDLESDHQYLKSSYNNFYGLYQLKADFFTETGLDPDFHLKGIVNPVTIKEIRKQIEEHKWYLSEKANNEINIIDAAIHWYESIYLPTLGEFEKIGIYKYFPFRTPAMLYLEIMTHKYYMSEKAGYDTGIKEAVYSYASDLGNDPNFLKFVKKIIRTVLKFVKK
ncbi:MAG: DUF4032 domain-containing protein [Ignavibacteriaceae bacterium]|nr:DUF4032 domain-containing protein [Ignavibacteriaceae bacterium]